jgi:SAM-dependent methyltransferase
MGGADTGRRNQTLQPSARDSNEFDAYDDETYRDAVERSIAFSGTGLDFFSRAKVRELLAIAARRVGDPNGLSFLDIGCGPGETDRLLEGRVHSLTGVDTSAGMIEAAGRRNPWGKYRLVDADAALPFATGSFDVSFAICVLHHVEPRGRAQLVAEAARVTKPGGAVLIFEHNPWNPLTRRVVACCEFDRDAVLLRRRESERLLRAAGLEGVDGAYIIYFTRESARLQRVERLLGSLPLGAQYVVSARRP